MWFKRQASQAVATMVLVLSSFIFGAGSVVHVDDDAPPGGDGLSWDTAYRFFQDGLASAAKGGVAEIRVGQGSYKPDRDEANPDGTGDRYATFQLLNGVALMGGYAGIGAKNPDARDIELYETILSGDLLGNDGPDFENNDENSYHVVTGWSINATAVLEGFTISSGNADFLDDHFPEYDGGGMLNLFSTSTVSNCTFSGNAALKDGGGMYNGGGSSPTVTNCSFSGNMAGWWGGGMRNSGGGAMVADCSFSDNTAGLRGGGMFNGVSSPTVTNCTFSGNTAGIGGGMCNSFTSSPTVTNCTFSGNSAGFGGGMTNNSTSSSTVTDCTFTGNTASSQGGGMYNFTSLQWVQTVTNCSFSGNTASSQGGGMYNFTSANVTNCTFSGNAADLGGGMFNEKAGQIVFSCILWNNSGGSLAGPGGTTVSYSDIEGGYDGEGNIDADPMFVDPGAGDHHLSSGSPCIDAADNTAVPKGIDTDLDGNPRFVDDLCTDNTGNGKPPLVDMGAYEFQVTCPWDLDCNGSVGAADLLSLLVSWGPCKGCPADFDGNGTVGASDLLALLVNWGPCP